MLTSENNQRLKAIRRLRRSKGVVNGRLLLEGPHLLETALDCALNVVEVFVSPKALARGYPVIRRLPRPPTVVEEELLDRMADADSPRGLIATVEAPDWTLESLCPAMRNALASRPSPRLSFVLADRLQDPGNLGALARTLDASGASGLALTPGSASPAHPRALRASAGSLLRLPTVTQVDWDSLDQELGAGRPWIALVPRRGVDLYSTSLPRDPVLCVGSEGAGLDAQIAERCNLEVSIPLEPGVESLNVTVAAALALYELRRQRVL